MAGTEFKPRAREEQGSNFHNSLNSAFLVGSEPSIARGQTETQCPPLGESKEMTWTSSKSGGLQRDKSSQTFPLESYMLWVK